ncbi:hypothetical protein VTK26DRAFT_5706 [Humicola hyalothermophila]
MTMAPSFTAASAVARLIHLHLPDGQAPAQGSGAENRLGRIADENRYAAVSDSPAHYSVYFTAVAQDEIQSRQYWTRRPMSQIPHPVRLLSTLPHTWLLIIAARGTFARHPALWFHTPPISASGFGHAQPCGLSRNPQL